jgi:hypothetical protein
MLDDELSNLNDLIQNYVKNLERTGTKSIIWTALKTRSNVIRVRFLLLNRETQKKKQKKNRNSTSHQSRVKDVEILCFDFSDASISPA